PFAIAQLEREGFPVEGMRSKSWDEFAEADAAAMDLIVTVCDSAAAEACPVVFGDFARVHWGLFDPAGVEGSDAQKAEAFDRAHQIIKRRLQAFLEIPDSAWDDRVALKARLDPIAQID
ncbi:MAG: arsenate reductase ArsC, partial [Stenotrophomonas sp.]